MVTHLMLAGLCRQYCVHCSNAIEICTSRVAGVVKYCVWKRSIVLNSAMPYKAIIYNIITKLHCTGYVLDKKKF
jgi:hypothetical protein